MKRISSDLRCEIGKIIIKEIHGLKIRLRVNDVRVRFGITSYFVSVDGQESNQIWI